MPSPPRRVVCIFFGLRDYLTVSNICASVLVVAVSPQIMSDYRRTTVVVTGCSGYIGSCLTKKLCELGFNVRGTVRSIHESRKIDHLRDLCPLNPPILYTADLNIKGSFERAFDGATYVLHTASPFFKHSRVKDPKKELIEPAVNGTLDVMEEARKAGVKRVVITSSANAVTDTSCAPIAEKVYDEKDWNPTTRPSYALSKVLAEKAAWKFSSEHPCAPELVSILPGFTVGPPASKRNDSESIRLIRNLLEGHMKHGSPPMSFGCVDVREVVDAHVNAMLTPTAKQQRYLCQSAHRHTFLEMANMLRDTADFKGYPLPKKYMANMKPAHPSKRHQISSEKIQIQLGIKLRPLKDSLVDMAKTMLEFGIIVDPSKTQKKNLRKAVSNL